MREIVPSLLSADFTKLRSQIRSVERAGAKRLHIDIMDGHFVPNLTLGPFIVAAIRRITNLHLETHLMIDNPESFIDPFIRAGSDTILIHIEVVPNPTQLLRLIKDYGKKAGLVINPATDFNTVKPYLSFIDHLLVMTVNPGFGAQKMIMEALEKVRQARPFADKHGFLIEIDGGVNQDTIGIAKEAGTDLFVAGHAVFGQPKPFLAFRRLERILRNEK